MSNHGEWFVADYCKCGWYVVPFSGDKWFTNKEHPVCPECGASCYDRSLVTGRMEKLARKKWWHLPKWKFAPMGESHDPL